jgi:hypothetical protein
MKKLTMILLLLYCLGMMLGLMACTPPDAPPSGPSDEPTADDDTPPADDETPDREEKAMLFNEDGSFRYAVVRPELNNAEINKCAAAFRSELQDLFEVDIDISDDWVDSSTTEDEIAAYYEILIGETNRPETKQVLDSLEDYTYAVKVVGNKIVIVGKEIKGTLKAVQYFMDNYIKGSALLNETLDCVDSYIPDPIDVVLEDKSTGETRPQLVQTKYPTEDVVIADIVPTEMGYAVDPTGRTDSTKGLQKALDDCSDNGGGTVYLPAGTYVISDNIKIPSFVTLRGDWQDPDVGTEYGTIISVWTESKDDQLSGLFRLGGSGGVVGLTVYYPHQSLDNVLPYPFTFYTDGKGSRYMLSTVKNVTVINGYRGIGACCLDADTPPAHEQLTVENFKGTFLYCGAEVYNQADVGTWQNVTISNKYWKEAAADCMTAADATKLDNYTIQNSVGLKLGDLEWTEFTNLKIDGYKLGIHIVKGKRIQFAGSLYDVTITNCTRGIAVTDLDPRWGMIVARGTIEGGIYNATDGLVKLCDVKVEGKLSGKVKEDNDHSLIDHTIDYTTSYVKPVAKFYLASLDKDISVDSSALLQAVLDEAGKTGGVVYVPAGAYRFDQPIVVPAGVELRGASSVATRDQGGLSLATLFLCYYGDDASSNTTDTAFITLSGENAGLNGVRIIYPENGVRDADLKTTYTVRGTASGVYIVNSCIASSGYGVDFSGCDNHFIKKVTTCCYYNTFLLGGKNGVMIGCLQNGTVSMRTNAPGLVDWFKDESQIQQVMYNPLLRKTSQYVIIENAENQLIYNTFCYGCATFVINKNSEKTTLINVGCDNIGDYQLDMKSGSLVLINSMRYNGASYKHDHGKLELYNRITINDKNEKTYIQSK